MVRVVEPSSITAVINTADDMVLHGLHISPDIDTVTYTLAGLDNKETGWGIAGETWNVHAELGRIGGKNWFQLGDRDLATHLYRTQRLSEGASLSEVTAELARRRGVIARLLPMSDDPVRTRLTIATDTGSEDGDAEIDFQDYFVRHHHDVSVSAVRFAGAENAKPAAGVVEAVESAERVIVCPSNPLVSIGPILAVPGILDVLQRRRAQVVAVSPIIAGTALKGPADRLLRELGSESSALGVARLYAPWVSTMVIDEADRELAHSIEALGMRCVVTPTIMSTAERAESLAREVVGVVL
jgi:LPPG:FO 2-phospho-L-lactate transferase